MDRPALAGHKGESRWVMVGTVLATIALHLTLPKDVRAIDILWLYPAVSLTLLLVLAIGDPGRIDNPAPWLGAVTGSLIALITLNNAFNAIHLVQLIITNARLGSAYQLLGSGASIWLVNVLAFGLWYWDLDQGGAAERAVGTDRLPAFLFPEMTNPEVVREGWYATLIDYLYASFAVATSFSPADVSAIKRWSKVLLTFESVVSLLLAVLVVARAINILPSN